MYVRSLAAGQRVRESVTQFLEEKLKLEVNREKSAVAPVGERKFLGHRLLLNGKLGTLLRASNARRKRSERLPAVTEALA
jgi:RNA-directed DNA polymerase